MKKKSIGWLILILSIIISSCNNQKTTTTLIDSTALIIPDSANFNLVVSGKQVKLYSISNSNGMKVAITNYGGRVVSILVPDQKGKLTDVALGYDTLTSYQNEKELFFGAIIGRYANRIAKGKFNLDNKEYQLELNDSLNTLNGGISGFYDKVFDASQPNDSTLILSLDSPNREGGYPGNLKVNVVYTLTATNGLKIDYQAQSDKKTIINLTNHTYFNLNGEGDSTILDHVLMIDADDITPVDGTLIPTGLFMKVKGTPFDFNKPTVIGKRINVENDQLKIAKGYDQNFVLNNRDSLGMVATVYSARTGIKMSIFTDQPGLQLYTGNFLKGIDHDGKNGKSYPSRSGFCLETQHFPDSPNKPNFPSTVLNKGDTYKTTTIYQFSTLK